MGWSLADTVIKGLGLATLFTAKLIAKGIRAAVSRCGGGSGQHDECRIVEEAILRRARKEGLRGEVPACVLKNACRRYLEGEDLKRVVKDAVEWWEEIEAYRRSRD